MRVLFLSRFFYPHIGGVEKHVLEISRILKKKDFDITVLTEQLSKTSKEGIIEGIKIRRIDVGKDDWFKKFRIWREIWKNKDLIRQSDVIHCHDVFFWYLPFRFIYPRKPVYSTFHGYEGNNLPSKKAIFAHKITEKLSRGNICIGDFLRKWYGTKPTHITYGGVEIPNSKLQINTKYKILFLGRLEEETGIMEYLKALELLKNNGYDLELTVLGDGSLRKKSERFCKVNNLKTVFKGFSKDVNKFILQSNYVFVSRYLGILEAMAARKFVFTQYNNAIKKDYLKMTPFAKFISISANSEELLKNIEFYFKHTKEREEMIDKGFNWVKNQTWEHLEEVYLSLWQNAPLHKA